MEQKTIVVTGGAGFIGSHLVDRLVELGHRVAIVDDLSAGKLQRVNKAARFHHVSITDDALDEVFQRERPQVVYHLAAQASVSVSVQKPIHDANVNVLGTLRLADCARRYGVEKFIFASTGGAIYGEPKHLPCTENDPVAPLSPYGMSKYCAEQYLELYRRLHDLRYTILRYGNVYGPRQDPHGEAGVVAIFAQLMLNGKQPTIFGDGNQERDFVYVGDVVEANIRALEAGDNRAYNIGSGKPVSVNRIFQLLKDIVQYTWRPAYAAPRPGDVYRIYLDPSRAKQELGWEATTPLEEGLRQTVEHLAQGLHPSTEGQPPATV